MMPGSSGARQSTTMSTIARGVMRISSTSSSRFIGLAAAALLAGLVGGCDVAPGEGGGKPDPKSQRLARPLKALPPVPAAVRALGAAVPRTSAATGEEEVYESYARKVCACQDESCVR